MKQKLRIINRAAHYDPTLNLSYVEPSIVFLEQTTGIISESNVNYIGRFEPTLNDYNKWSNWLKENKSRIYWDKKAKTVKVKKAI